MFLAHQNKFEGTELFEQSFRFEINKSTESLLLRKHL